MSTKEIMKELKEWEKDLREKEEYLEDNILKEGIEDNN